MTGSSPFHEGEQGVQTRLGVSRPRHADVIGNQLEARDVLTERILTESFGRIA